MLERLSEDIVKKRMANGDGDRRRKWQDDRSTAYKLFLRNNPLTLG